MWEKTDSEDREITIGSKHPFFYVVGINRIIKDFGFCTVHVREGLRYMFNGMEKSHKDQWKDVWRLLTPYKVKIIKESKHHMNDNCTDYKLEW